MDRSNSKLRNYVKDAAIDGKFREVTNVVEPGASWLGAGIATPDVCFTFRASEAPEPIIESRLSDILEPPEIVSPKYNLNSVTAGNVLRTLQKYGKPLDSLFAEKLKIHALGEFEIDPPACPLCGSTRFRDRDDWRTCSPCKARLRKL